jgi:hypothetical protein
MTALSFDATAFGNFVFFIYIKLKPLKSRFPVNVSTVSPGGVASASGTRSPGFEFRQGIRFLGKHNSAVVYKIT